MIKKKKEKGGKGKETSLWNTTAADKLQEYKKKILIYFLSIRVEKLRELPRQVQYKEDRLKTRTHITLICLTFSCANTTLV